jgi:hypothetical protein
MFRAVSCPVDEELLSAAMWLFIDNAIDKVFFEAV